MSDDKQTSTGEPLPIWFFVGLILTVYGVLLIVANFVSAPGTTVLAETHPCLWWGAVTTVCGGVFLGIGLRVRSLDIRARKEDSK
jgi:H+/Cl- antiporter ClcA